MLICLLGKVSKHILVRFFDANVLTRECFKAYFGKVVDANVLTRECFKAYFGKALDACVLTREWC